MNTLELEPCTTFHSLPSEILPRPTLLVPVSQISTSRTGQLVPSPIDDGAVRVISTQTSNRDR